MNFIVSHKKLIVVGLAVVISSFLYYQLIYLKNNPTLTSQSVKYSNNPQLIKSQDQITGTDKQTIKEAAKRPLLSYLPYSDGYVYISTSRSPYHLLIQYTTTLADANKTYDGLLKKYNDSGRHYDVNFRKVPILIIKE